MECGPINGEVKMEFMKKASLNVKVRVWYGWPYLESNDQPRNPTQSDLFFFTYHV